MYTALLKRAWLTVMALIICIFASTAMASDLVVSNVQVEQRPGTAFVDVSYDLETIGNMPVTVRLFLSVDGGVTYSFQCQSVSGDAGEGVESGIGLQMTWNAGLDWPGLVELQCRLRVVADDSPYAAGFVYIRPGTFTMGSPADEPGRIPANEGPQHEVTLTNGFYMSKYEVTEALWDQVMEGVPTASQLPKAVVSWDMAVQFCNALSVQEGLTPAYTIHGSGGDVTWDQDANGYRLPTEAEWEYACRAGGTTAFANGPITHTECFPLNPNLDAIGWYCGNRHWEEDQAAVGQKQANTWGLYDMHGNLQEWVWCGRRWYTSGAQQDPVMSPGPGANRVIRGGSWICFAQYCRSAYRGSVNPGLTAINVGFRLVRSAF